MPLVDVVVPVYRGRRWIPDAIRSLEAQTFDDWRLIAVDDACPDDSGGLVTELRPDATVVRLKSNLGPAGARAEAVRHSGARLIALLDQDDLWEPTKLEKQVAAFEQQPAIRAVHTDAALIDELGRDLGEADTNALRRLDWAHGTRAELVRAQFEANRFKMASSVIDRQTWLDLGGQSDPYGAEDWGFWIRLLARGHRVAHVPEPLLLWRQHETNTSGDKRRSEQLRSTRRRMALRYAYLLGPRVTVRTLRR